MKKTLKYKDFKKIIHKKHYEHVLTEFIFRPISNRVVFLLIKNKSKITANNVTSLSLIIVFIFIFLFINWQSNNSLVLIWSFLFLLFHLLDVIDWDLARSRILILWEKWTYNWKRFDTLVHLYYNFWFFSSMWFLLSKIFINNYIFYIWILIWVCLIITDVIYWFIYRISIENNIKQTKNYVNFKMLKNKNNISYKSIIYSFMWFMWFSIIFFIWSIIDIIIDTNYIKLILFLLFWLVVIFWHIQAFKRFIKLW